MGKAYIFDIDGTLADLSHRLHFIESEPKNWDSFFDACDRDKPIDSVIQVLRSVAWPSREAAEENPRIIYLTGRPERVRAKTKKWLEDNTCPSGLLCMRVDGDHRPDTVTKKELIQDLLKMNCEVVGIFEDRPSVCRVWRNMGLTVFQLKHEEF